MRLEQRWTLWLLPPWSINGDDWVVDSSLALWNSWLGIVIIATLVVVVNVSASAADRFSLGLESRRCPAFDLIRDFLKFPDGRGGWPSSKHRWDAPLGLYFSFFDLPFLWFKFLHHLQLPWCWSDRQAGLVLAILFGDCHKFFSSFFLVIEFDAVILGV